MRSDDVDLLESGWADRLLRRSVPEVIPQDRRAGHGRVEPPATARGGEPGGQ